VVEKENISTRAVRYFLPSYIRSVTNDDGGVLLDLRSGRCLRLNPVGGEIWNILQRYAEGVTSDELVIEMVKVFPDAGPDLLRRDTGQFLRDLENKGLIQSNGNGSHSDVNPSKWPQKKFNELMSEPPSERAYQTSLGAITGLQDSVGFAREKGSFAYSALAMLALIGVDLALKIAGFPLVYRIVSRLPARRLIARTPPPVERICASVDAACRCYIKPALCLQRSVVATCMLRLAGAPAEMVIAARVMPLQSHAWVEVDGRVVNDESKVKSFYQILDRC
jgi:hypothetical protein